MAQASTIARPYARAAFELARDADDLAGWQRELELVATIVRDPVLAAALDSPKLSGAQLAEIVIGVAGDALRASVRNLVRLLADRKRLAVMAELLTAFVELRRDAERKVEVELITAVPADGALRARIVAALEERLGRGVELRAVTDPGVIGGAVVRAGDLVIDASVRGRLERLAVALTH